MELNECCYDNFIETDVADIDYDDDMDTVFITRTGKCEICGNRLRFIEQYGWKRTDGGILED